jgi:hypothetical protein
MNLNKVIQNLRNFMPKKVRSFANQKADDGITLKLVAVKNLENDGKLRSDELQNLVTHIVLLGTKRGRPSKKDLEARDAA